MMRTRCVRLAQRSHTPHRRYHRFRSAANRRTVQTPRTLHAAEQQPAAAIAAGRDPTHALRTPRAAQPHPPHALPPLPKRGEPANASDAADASAAIAAGRAPTHALRTPRAAQPHPPHALPPLPKRGERFRRRGRSTQPIGAAAASAAIAAATPRARRGRLAQPTGTSAATSAA